MKVCSVCRRCFEDLELSCSEENHGILTEAREGSRSMIPNYRLEFLRETAAADGETYRAANTILNKPYLIRILAPGLFDETAKKRFLTEAQALSAVIHPNVARVFESGVLSDGALYVVTELLTAPTLRECLESANAPSEVAALAIARQAAEGLEAIHAAGAPHRNIKPENLILTTDAENRFLVKLQNLDFGAVRQKQVNTNGDLHLSDLRYFSPEQCAAPDTADAQSDVYSLGVVLYETLAGRVPFDAAYADALIAKQKGETPPPVKINNFDIRMLLTHTLTDALQKQTRTRLKSANAFARRLRHIEQLATHSSTPPPALAYPATMHKTAIVFAPPARIEKIEKPAAAENLIPVETRTAAENPAEAETSTAAELPEPFVVKDYSTTKLPPIESIIAPASPAEVLEAEAVAALAATDPEIHKTSEPVLIRWEQPDDVPTVTAALDVKKKEVADAEFVSPEVFIEEENYPTGADETEYVSEAYKTRRDYALINSVFSYNDTGGEPARSWNLPEKRTILTGAAILGFLVVAIGGTFLNRQIQSARSDDQTSAKSSPNVKSLPKSAKPDKVSETDKLSTVKTADLTVSNADAPDVPDYQPREAEEKTLQPVSPARRKKRAVRTLSESPDNSTSNKTAAKEVFDKQGGVKSAVKNQVSTANKTDVFTRPRVVKNP